jgi:FKBP-type peptidyl-prolyl cis-trans isomerase
MSQSKPTPPIRSFYVLLLLGVVLLSIAFVARSGLFSRKNPGRPINATMREALSEDTPEFTPADADYIRKNFAAAHVQKSGLMYVPRERGIGEAMPKDGQTVTVNYEGRLTNGTVFDSTAKSGQPFSFVLGKGMVIAGWEEALHHMRKGEKRTIVVPYWLGYGVDGRPPTIPQKATLIFDVELVDFK